jgi:hypothetical protein
MPKIRYAGKTFDATCFYFSVWSSNYPVLETLPGTDVIDDIEIVKYCLNEGGDTNAHLESLILFNYVHQRLLSNTMRMMQQQKIGENDHDKKKQFFSEKETG